mmetsp:Transcript_16304/g.36170  ORF Transcript_16304/g.36170 Transcript_16304/m.36170 type:complete len:224 (-) Transcript_16304:76-747(-)
MGEREDETSLRSVRDGKKFFSALGSSTCPSPEQREVGRAPLPSLLQAGAPTAPGPGDATLVFRSPGKGEGAFAPCLPRAVGNVFLPGLLLRKRGAINPLRRIPCLSDTSGDPQPSVPPAAGVLSPDALAETADDFLPSVRASARLRARLASATAVSSLADRLRSWGAELGRSSFSQLVGLGAPAHLVFSPVGAKVRRWLLPVVPRARRGMWGNDVTAGAPSPA